GVTPLTIAEGRILDCRNARLDKAPPLKCVLRALGYTKGTFAVRTVRAPPKPYPLDVPVPELLADRLFELDELQVIRQRLPEPGERIVLAKPLIAPLAAPEERDLEILKAAHNLGQADPVLDAS